MGVEELTLSVVDRMFVIRYRLKSRGRFRALLELGFCQIDADMGLDIVRRMRLLL